MLQWLQLWQRCWDRTPSIWCQCKVDVQKAMFKNAPCESWHQSHALKPLSTLGAGRFQVLGTEMFFNCVVWTWSLFILARRCSANTEKNAYCLTQNLWPCWRFPTRLDAWRNGERWWKALEVGSRFWNGRSKMFDRHSAKNWTKLNQLVETFPSCPLFSSPHSISKKSILNQGQASLQIPRTIRRWDTAVTAVWTEVSYEFVRSLRGRIPNAETVLMNSADKWYRLIFDFYIFNQSTFWFYIYVSFSAKWRNGLSL